MFFNLLGRIGLNTKPLEEGLDRSERKAASFADRVEHKVGKKLDKAFGVGLVAGVIVGQFHKLFEIVDQAEERVEKVQELSEKFKLTAETIQALQAAAAEAKMPVEEFMKKVQETGNIDQTIDRIKELRKNINFTAEEVQTLTETKGFWKGIAEKAGNFVEHVRAGISGAANSELVWIQGVYGHMKDGKSFSEASRLASQEDYASRNANKLNQASDLRADDAQLHDLLKPNKPEKPSARSTHASLTPWQSIGAFVGVPGDVITREQQKTNQILQRMETLSREQIAVLRQNGGTFQ